MSCYPICPCVPCVFPPDVKEEKRHDASTNQPFSGEFIHDSPNASSQVTLLRLIRLPFLVAYLVRRLPREIEEDCALLDLDLVLGVARILSALVFFLCHKLDVDTIDSTDELGLEYGLAFLLAAFVAGTWTAAVDASCDGDAINFVRLVTVYRDKDAVETTCQGDGNVWRYLEVGVGW